jgi:hypothetical protein
MLNNPYELCGCQSSVGWFLVFSKKTFDSFFLKYIRMILIPQRLNFLFFKKINYDFGSGFNSQNQT